MNTDCSIATDGPRSDGSWGVSTPQGYRVAWDGVSETYYFEEIPEICSNGIDDDHDGLVDCADSECIVLANAEISFLDLPSFDCGDNGQEEFTLPNGHFCSQDQAVSDTWLCCPNNYVASATASGWSCLAEDPTIEICNDGIDNLDSPTNPGVEGDGLIDCADPDCFDFNVLNGNLPSFDQYNCLGEDMFMTSDYCADNPADCEYTGPPNPPVNGVRYCSDGLDNDLDDLHNAMICCPEGKPAEVFGPNMWRCADTAPCYGPGYDCGTAYSDYYSNEVDFLAWLSDVDCLNPGNAETLNPSLACCEVASYGGYNYYTDSDNVRVI